MKSIFYIFIIFFSSSLTAQLTQIRLDNHWKFKKDSENKWYTATVPGCIHTDLYDNGLIPHPFVGKNESELQWISDNRWIYQTEFEVPQDLMESKNISLNFSGLDTYATIFLNDELIFESNNAFRIWKKDVKKLLKKNNILRIEFSPTKIIEEKKKKEIPYELPEGNRIFTRKAQFQYGWDWGPKFNSMGIWREIYLEFWDEAKMEDVYINQKNLTPKKASLGIEIETNSSENKTFQTIVYVNEKPVQTKKINLNPGKNKFEIPINISNPKFWWTHNLGEPYLYEFKIQLKDLNGDLLDEKVLKKGLRNIELVMDKDNFGESFYFKLNGEAVYMKGANYIPQSSFQNWVSWNDYEKMIQDAVDSNMNMLRVWGGGIYEDDYFYQLCDEKGILVWQDFMFACAMYPGDAEFLENVHKEAIDNVKRLRNHSSIALWCGNNESSEGWHRWGWQDGRSEAEKREIWKNYQKLFNGILPEVIKDLTDIPYWESSPKFGRGDIRYISEGDAHDWWVWHDGHPFENLEEKTPRFMSEFGFQSFPSLEIIRFINEGKSNSISTEEFKSHQKNLQGFDIIRTYMERDFPVPQNDDEYVYVSQILQAYGVGKGIEAQRRNKPYTMGSLYWQFNDCWPAVSWSGIDSFGNWKALQYQVRHSFQYLLVSFQKENKGLRILIINDLLENLDDELEVMIKSFEGEILFSFNKEIKVNKLGINKEILIDLEPYLELDNEIFVEARFGNFEPSMFYLVKPKDLKLEPNEIKITQTKYEDGFEINLKSKTLQKNVFLQTDTKGRFSENYFDLLPNEIKTVKFISKEKIVELKLKNLSLNFINQK